MRFLRQERDLKKDHENCEKWKLDALKNCKVVHNIIAKIEETTNSKFDESLLCCEVCPNLGLKGGLTSEPDILLCENSIGSAEEVKTVISHELVHFLDHLRKTDWNDVRALARSEVRAAKFSLECHNERSGHYFYDGNLEQPHLCSISQQFRRCVRDKAAESVKLVTNVSTLKARSIVDEVFEKSFNEEL